MSKISSFLAGYRTSPLHRLLEDASIQLEKISWFHNNDISVHSSDPKFTNLPDPNTVF